MHCRSEGGEGAVGCGMLWGGLWAVVCGPWSVGRGLCVCVSVCGGGWGVVVGVCGGVWEGRRRGQTHNTYHDQLDAAYNTTAHVKDLCMFVTV